VANVQALLNSVTQPTAAQPGIYCLLVNVIYSLLSMFEKSKYKFLPRPY